MAELNLDKIQARADAATPGPWYDAGAGILRAVHTRTVGRKHIREVRDDIYLLSGAMFDTYEDFEGGPDLNGEPCVDSYYDAQFIAHAREDVPALVARVRELEAENAKLRTSVGHLSEVVDGYRAWLEDARAEADRLGDRCAELESKVAELLPWARAAVEMLGRWYEDRRHDDAHKMRDRIDAGEFALDGDA